MDSCQYPESLYISKSGNFRKGPKAGCRAPNAPLRIDDKETDLFTLFQNPKTFFSLSFWKKIELSELTLKMIPIERHNKKVYSIYGVENEEAYLIRPDT